MRKYATHQHQNMWGGIMRKSAWLAVSLVMVLAVALFTASCAKKAVQTQPVSTAEPEVQAAPDKSAGEADEAGRLIEEQLRADAAETAFVTENVHFAFDSSALSNEARRIIKGKADYLRANPEIKVTVEGHCDDRGTDAYNIALGERRAESVKIFLVDLGIGSHRLNTVSYGKERPIVAGNNEDSWARNRRAQFVIN